MLLLACIGMVAVQTACTNYDADDHKFGNVVYLDVAETSRIRSMSSTAPLRRRWPIRRIRT